MGGPGLNGGTPAPGPAAATAARCPICAEANGCGAAAPQACWCRELRFDARLVERLPAALRGRACICRRCAGSPGFAADGCLRLDDLLDAARCRDLATRLDALDAGSAGTRCLLSRDWCRELVAQLRAHPAVAAVLPPDHLAVQCTQFEKSRERNWLVPMHQDLGIPVAARVAHAQLQGWSLKEGQQHVQPPASLLQRLLALRLHLDDCGEHDGALRVLPGTHLLGRVDEAGAAALRRSPPFGAERPCLATAGQAWLMRPLLLHASSKASGTSRRRVLHILFGPPDLPLGLGWPQAAC